MASLGGTVWFLGAGFSRGLGAPLFRDLFQGDDRIRATNSRLAQTVSGVLRLYRDHVESSSASLSGSLWRDPEEFIDVLESAAKADGGPRDLLKSLVPEGNLETLVEQARRALAVECSYFLRGADPATERWLPYRHWARKLGAGDTVISFNYDRVLELLQEKFPPEMNHYGVIAPSSHASDDIGAAWDMYAPALKLHGSVDWILRAGTIVVDPDPNLAVTCPSGTDLVLAVPGPDKAGLRSQFTGIRTLWDAAKLAVSHAGRIVFLGYRFPVTDAFARIYFLKAIKAASANRTLKGVEIVLGANEQDPDVARMKRLLAFACGGGLVEVTVVPLFAEDYLSISAAVE